MKKRFLNFLKKYWFCFLLSVIMVAGIPLTARYAYLYEIGGDMIRFDLKDLYLIYGIPIYSFIYGCLSYIILKKVWPAQLILYSIPCVYLFCANLIIDKEIDSWLNILIACVYPVVFSLIGIYIVSFVYKLIKSLRKSENSKTQEDIEDK